MKSILPQRKAYLWVILITFVLLISNQVFIQYWLFEKADDALVVNIAGRQRMLSQRIGMLSLADQQAPGSQSEELDSTFQLWKQSHYSFLDAESDFYVGNFSEIQGEFVQLSGSIEWVENYLNGNTKDASPEKLLSVLDVFLARMDGVVKQLENRSEDRLWFISRSEFVLMILTIVVFIIEIFIISRPYIKRIIHQANLFESITWYQSHKVRSANAKIQGLVGIILESEEDLSEQEMKDYLKMIFSESQNLDVMTKKVVEMSQEREFVSDN